MLLPSSTSRTAFAGNAMTARRQCAAGARTNRPQSRVDAAKLHVPGQDATPGPVFDILYGSAMQAQQVTGCYNNCLATSVAIVKAAELLGVSGYQLRFGHLAPTKEGIMGQVPHVWVEHEDSRIMDATLSDAMPAEDLFKYKSQLQYVLGPAPNPLANAGLPAEASTQERLQHFSNHIEEYVQLLSTAQEGTAQASAFLLYASLTQGLGGAKDEIQAMLQSQVQ